MGSLLEFLPGDITKTITMSPVLMVLGVVLALISAVYTLTSSGRRNGSASNPQRSAKASSKDSLEIKPLNGLDYRAVEPTQYRPFKPIFHITMALQADSPSELITIDSEYLDRVSLRRQIIAQHGDMVHACLPAGIEAVRELHQFLLRDYLPTRFPTMFQLRDEGRHLDNLVTGRSFPTAAPEDEDAAAALRVLGETVEEDMFLLMGEPEGHRAVAFLCCFPSGFDPSTKVGKLLREIHTPVPSYEKIGPSMERFFSKIEVGKNVKRTNWSMQTHSDLFHYDRHDQHKSDEPVATEEIDMSKTYARIELQTLSRLPKTRAILFSFKTYLYPVESLKKEGLGPQVADAIEGLKTGNAPGMWRYKGAPQWGEPICKYLRS
ncbi:hypothetical protein A0O28_0105780 [Trichoderma guizhouense]|uniref:HRQ family protein 2 n=1 Tax=Trichoderma guizhouense TaxID=1491466 RepID=A0A1T3CQK3_9HYPO|nr:hypothetical protein A0O28_0105780 [Trichoderma guizhouense]